MPGARLQVRDALLDALLQPVPLSGMEPALLTLGRGLGSLQPPQHLEPRAAPCRQGGRCCPSASWATVGSKVALSWMGPEVPPEPKWCDFSPFGELGLCRVLCLSVSGSGVSGHRTRRKRFPCQLGMCVGSEKRLENLTRPADSVWVREELPSASDF